MRRRTKRVLGCAGLLTLLLGGPVYWLLAGGLGSLIDLGQRAAGRRPGPIHLAPLLDHLRPTPTFEGPHASPATDSAERVMATLERIESRMQHSRYQHRTRVREAEGRYDWDCSGMATWVLARSAPQARRSLGSGRPVARTFHHRIARARIDRPRRGWQRIEPIADVRPGDVFAWERPPGFRSRNSGHVGFVVSAPVEIREGLWAVRILDSTSLAHQDDTRADDPDGGTGRGTMAFVTDARGRATHYGWRGTRSRGHIETEVLFGRVN